MKKIEQSQKPQLTLSKETISNLGSNKINILLPGQSLFNHVGCGTHPAFHSVCLNGGGGGGGTGGGGTIRLSPTTGIAC